VVAYPELGSSMWKHLRDVDSNRPENQSWSSRCVALHAISKYCSSSTMPSGLNFDVNDIFSRQLKIIGEAFVRGLFLTFVVLIRRSRSKLTRKIEIACNEHRTYLRLDSLGVVNEQVS